jgi:hypothetical protein
MTISIAGAQWEIKLEDTCGGGFDSSIPAIVVGTKMPKLIPTILLHEILEAILAERGCRYRLTNEGDNGDLMFVFNHKEFDNLTRDLATALERFLNIDSLINNDIVRRRTRKGK